MTNNQQQQPWQQQDGETDLKYQYFQLYQHQHPTTRNLQEVVNQLSKNDKHITYEHIRNVSSQEHWQRRIKAYDKHTQSLVLKSKESHIREMNNRHADISKDVIGLLYDELMNPELRDQDPTKRPYLYQALIRGLEGAVRIERLSLGESTSNSRQVNEGINNLMMVLTDSKKELLKQNDKDRKVKQESVIDIDYMNVTNESE